MTVAEEVHFLYPEGEWALNRIKDDPAHLLFKAFGEQVPKEDWNHPGTKQGVYMMGPQGEYLEGAHAASGDAEGLVRRMRRALERWAALRKEKGYENLEVPDVETKAPPGIEERPLALRVFLRDLPRERGDRSGRRFEESDRTGIWPDFVRWAWNTNWIGFDSVDGLVPKGAEEAPVAEGVLRRICREVLVDNVRGQNGAWKNDEVREAELLMKRVETRGAVWTIEYRGRAAMKSERQSYEPVLYGRARWDSKRERFQSFELVALGDRAGQGTFNQRARDLGPAPMGIALVLHHHRTGGDD